MKMEVLVGMIASGKSTYAKKRAEEGAIIVNADSITMAVHANNYKLYSKGLSGFYKAVETNIIISALLIGKDVVIDRTNLTKDTRQRYVQLGKVFGAERIAVMFPICKPVVHAARRVESDSRGYTEFQWERIAQGHLNNFEAVELDEGFASVQEGVFGE